jgi:hypothetical protein
MVIGERDGLAWVLRNQRMAFPKARLRDAEALKAGDRLLMYTTRGCFGNPTRDRGRVMGEASVKSLATLFKPPIKIAGRSFGSSIQLDIRSLAPARSGVELAPLVSN